MTGSTGGRYRDALRQRDFRLMVVAYVVDALGGWAYSVVLAVYVWDRTHSTQWLAAMASAGWLTSLLVGGYAGVLADRYERTRLMIVSALSSTAVMCVIAVVALAPPLRMTWVPELVVSVEPIWKMKTALASPCASSVRLPVESMTDVEFL